MSYATTARLLIGSLLAAALVVGTGLHYAWQPTPARFSQPVHYTHADLSNYSPYGVACWQSADGRSGECDPIWIDGPGY